MIYLELFLTFFKIGIFTFGGGHAMIAMIMDETNSKGWMSLNELKQLIAVSESTPGPFAINIATFIGSNTGGFLGSFVATLGVVLPSFIIILIIAALLANFTKYRGVKKVMDGIRPVIIGLILAAGISILLTNLLPNFPSFDKPINFEMNQLALFIVLGTFKIAFGKKMGPIKLIGCAAILGILVYGI